jgi:hypothetical protein
MTEERMVLQMDLTDKQMAEWRAVEKADWKESKMANLTVVR